MFLNNQRATEEIKREIKNKFLETNGSEKTTRNRQNAAKAVLRGKLIAIQSYLKKQTNKKKKTLNRQSNFTSKTTGKRRETTKTKLVKGKKS